MPDEKREYVHGTGTVYVEAPAGDVKDLKKIYEELDDVVANLIHYVPGGENEGALVSSACNCMITFKRWVQTALLEAEQVRQRNAELHERLDGALRRMELLKEEKRRLRAERDEQKAVAASLRSQAAMMHEQLQKFKPAEAVRCYGLKRVLIPCPLGKPGCSVAHYGPCPGCPDCKG